MYGVDPNSPEFQRILSQHWYYSVELKPGLFTRGDEHPNVVCTRELLARLAPSGLDVCDIGTMEGVIPVLLKRRGARSVVALDAIDSGEKVRLVQVCTGENFEYIPRVSLSRVKEALSERARLSSYSSEWGQTKVQTGFDVVVLSGGATDGLEVTVSMRRFASEMVCDAPVRLTEMSTGDGTGRVRWAEGMLVQVGFQGCASFFNCSTSRCSIWRIRSPRLNK
jgi:hypothetical protein